MFHMNFPACLSVSVSLCPSVNLQPVCLPVLFCFSVCLSTTVRCCLSLSVRIVQSQDLLFQLHSGTSFQAQLTSLLQLMCLAEGVCVRPDAINALVDCCRADIRRCIHTVQFWCCNSKTTPATTSSSSSESTSIPLHLDLVNRIPVDLPMSVSSGASLNKASIVCPPSLLDTWTALPVHADVCVVVFAVIAYMYGTSSQRYTVGLVVSWDRHFSYSIILFIVLQCSIIDRRVT